MEHSTELGVELLRNHTVRDVDNYTWGLSWNSHWMKWDPIDGTVNLVTAFLMLIVFILGTVGNCTVLFIYQRNKKLQTAANMYVVNLASTDLIMCLVNFPMLIWALFQGSWPLGYIGCQLYGFIGAVSGFVSMNTLTAMAIDRYHVIYRNVTINRNASKSVHNIIISVIWVYSLIWAIIPLVGWGHYTLSGGRTSCCFDYLSRDPVNISFVVCLFIFCFTIQFLLILYCYGGLLVYIYRYERLFKEATYIMTANGHARRRKLNRELKVAKLIFIIISAFCLSWLPFATVALIGTFGDVTLLSPLTSMIPGLLAKTSTVINPVLYAISHPKFRGALRRNCPKMAIGKRRSFVLSNIYNTSIYNKSGDHYVVENPR